MGKFFKIAGKLITLFIVFSIITSCGGKDKYFERGTLDLPGSENVDREGKRSLSGGDGQTIYNFVQREKTTFRSMSYKIDKSGSMVFEPEIRGDVTVYFTTGKLKKTDSNDLSVSIFLESGGDKKLLREFQLNKKAVTFDQKLTLTGSDRIIVDFNGNSQIFITEPVYLRSNNKSPVFLIIADTLRADHLGVYGHKGNISRNITRFSKDCAVFNNCFSTTTWTLPSHMSLFTSRNIFNHGVYTKKLRLSDKIPVLTELISRNRFASSLNEGMFVKYKYGFYRGFDTYTSKKWRSGVFSKKMFKHMAKFIGAEGFNNSFSFLHTYQVHSPFRLHPGLQYSDDNKTKEYTTDLSFPYRLAEHDRLFTYRPRSERRKKGIIAAYNSELEFFDHWFGYFIDALKRSGMYENSLIIFMSDHGEEFFENGAWGHGNNLYNETLHIPLMIKFPSGKYKGKRIVQNCSIMDVLPTVLDYLNISLEFETDGESLLPILNNPGNSNNDRYIESLLIHTGSKIKLSQVPQMISVIKGKFKLIYNLKYSKEMNDFYSGFPLPEYREYELYDLSKDFAEENDLSSDPGLKNILSDLKNRINLIKRKIFSGKIKGVPLKVTNKDLENLKALGYL